MTSAIGKAATKATTIVKANALSKFTSWRTLSTDMLLAPRRGGQTASPVRCGDGVFARALYSEYQWRSADGYNIRRFVSKPWVQGVDG